MIKSLNTPSMKKILFIFAALPFLFLGCDKIEIPKQIGGSNPVPTNDTIRKVMIEDFTGHICPNCPKAARMIDSLKRAFPGQVIGVAIHFDFWGDPCTSQTLPQGAPPGSFTEDFRVGPELVDYNGTFGINNFNPPTGFVNRSEYPNSSSVTSWPSTVSTLLAKPMTAYLKITPNYNTSSRVLNVNVSGEFLNDTMGTFKLALYLVEDSLTGYQEDNTLPGGLDPNFIFNDVFRGCINTPGSIGGEIIANGTVPNHTRITYNMPNAFTVNSTFNDRHCKIVAFLYKTTDYGILQATECNLR